jgi:hypothetical protein
MQNHSTLVAPSSDYLSFSYLKFANYAKSLLINITLISFTQDSRDVVWSNTDLMTIFFEVWSGVTILWQFFWPDDRSARFVTQRPSLLS